tara:strand:- start:8242 stop:8709 length:468 start_codon:yes stop_codon:yes gene_type:complete
MAKTITNQDSVSAFSLKCTSAQSSAKTTFRMFDADAVVSAIQGGTVSATTSGTITPSAITSTTVANPIVVSGFNYQTSSSSSQFAESFDILRGSIDGRIVKHPNVIAKAKRNTQFDSLLLTIDERFIIDSQTAIEVSVIASEEITLTFFVEGFLT